MTQSSASTPTSHSLPGPTTFAQALAALLRSHPGEPLVTFYDEASGERVELSVTTFANWVSKAAGLLADEHDLEKGGLLRIDLPPHWLGTVFLGAAWTIGARVVVDDAVPVSELDAVVCGPDTLERWAEESDDVAVLACSLLPLGVRFRDPVPSGVHDVGIEIWSQPDAFTPWDAPDTDTPALHVAGHDLSQGDLVSEARSTSLLEEGGRLLSTANPASVTGWGTFVEPLVRAGSLVLAVGADAPRLEALAAQERTTAASLG